MTARAGGFYNVQPTAPSAGLRGIGRSSGAFYAFQSRLPIYWNTGWYLGVQETPWLSYGAPSSISPSGHTPLTNVQYELLESLP